MTSPIKKSGTKATKSKPRKKAPAQPKKYNLFVYGALLNEHHVELLLNRKVGSVPATLNGYMRIAHEEGFCFIVKHHSAKTNGRILLDLSNEEIERLDKFEDEGNLYFRKTVFARREGKRQRCMTYIGNIAAMQKTFGHVVRFEDRYSRFIEKKIDEIIAEMPTDRPDITRRVLYELMGSEVEGIIESHFDGNYICNYIMIQAFSEARPPSLKKVLKNEPELLPYAGNYMRLACQHIVFNQFVDLIRHDFPHAVRVSQQYFRHGLAMLLSFMLYNQKKDIINRLFDENELGVLVDGRSYRDYATIAIDIVDAIYRKEDVVDIIDYVDNNWYSTPTPIGAELEFSPLGKDILNAEPGDDKLYDGFYWFQDFDMYHRTWRLGGHIDSHRNITAGQARHRGFLEYALGRYQIVGDLSRPLFDCPWAMSKIINEAVKFLDIPPHSLHLSMEITGSHSHITDKPHTEEDLICLMMLGGDLREDENGKLREWRIYNNELDTNFMKSLHFSDRKYHFSKASQDESEASDTMEYKYLRLHKEEANYENIIVALKGYQFESHGRPICIQKNGEKELPEQTFLRKWAAKPQSLDKYSIDGFVEKIEKGLLEEINSCKLDRHKTKVLRNIEKILVEQNKLITSYE